MKYLVVLNSHLQPRAGALPTPDAREMALDELMNILLDMEVEDATVAGTMSTGEFEVSQVVDAPEALLALQTAVDTVVRGFAKLGIDASHLVEAVHVTPARQSVRA